MGGNHTPSSPPKWPHLLRLQQWWEVTTPTLPNPGGFQHLKLQSWKDKHHRRSLTPSLFLFSSRKGTENHKARKLSPSAGVVKGTSALIYTRSLLPFFLINTPNHPLRKKKKTSILLSKVSVMSLALQTTLAVIPEMKLKKKKKGYIDILEPNCVYQLQSESESCSVASDSL